MSGFDHALAKVLDAARGGVGAQSTGEQLMAALCLNRSDWLAEMGYTIAEALDRVGEWQAYIPVVARRVREEQRKVRTFQARCAVRVLDSDLQSAVLNPAPQTLRGHRASRTQTRLAQEVVLVVVSAHNGCARHHRSMVGLCRQQQGELGKLSEGRSARTSLAP